MTRRSRISTRRWSPPQLRPQGNGVAATGPAGHVRTVRGSGGGPDRRGCHAGARRLAGGFLPGRRRHAKPGLSVDPAAAHRTGDERGGQPPAGVNVLPPSITVGAHMVHAVGLAWAESLKGTDAVAMTMFGDGATSEGDFHEAMNFAGVYQTPTIFVCQNNGWAISMPRARQTASETIAQKADGYGMPWELVDGNDVLAMYDAAARAVDRARRGEGPNPDRGADTPEPGTHHGRRRRALPIPRGNRRMGRAGPTAAGSPLPRGRWDVVSPVAGRD